MDTSTTTATDRARTDASSLRLLHGSIALVVASAAILFVTLNFTTTSDRDFHHTADYWLTAAGLPFALAGIGVALAVHRLHHGADGRLGTVGTWINTLALVELFAQCTASLIESSEVRWGPSYPICTALSFVGVALISAGSWRVGLLPRWMLGVWPLVWVLGSFAGFGPMPLVLVVFLVVLGVTATRRVDLGR
jgi:hypothetical protein